MDELNSIMLGGDAFITKPYNTAILLAKIASLLKKAYPAQQREQIVYGDAVLHLESSSLDYNGRSVELTKNELKILYYLFKNGGKICSRGDMIEYLWDNQLYVDDNALSVNINRIREKLAGIGLTDFIKTKHRQGVRTSPISKINAHTIRINTTAETELPHTSKNTVSAAIQTRFVSRNGSLFFQYRLLFISCTPVGALS